MRDGLPWTWLSGADAEVAAISTRATAPPVGYAGPRLLRAVAVGADPETTWRWLCQIQVGPYSYDLLDNRGRRSPRELVQGLTDPAVGDRLLRIFEVVAVTPGAEFVLELTDRGARRAFGDLVCCYRVDAVPDRPNRSVLSGRIDCAVAEGAPARVRGWLLAWGDLVMMRKQLRTLAALAEGGVDRET